MLEAFTAVFNAKIAHSGAKLTLLALGDQVRPNEFNEWNTFIGEEHLVHQTGRALRTIREDLRWLQAEGWCEKRPRSDLTKLRRGDFQYEYLLNKEKILAARDPWFDRRKRLASGGSPARRSPPNSGGDDERSPAISAGVGERSPAISAGVGERSPAESSTTTGRIQHDHRQNPPPHIEEPVSEPDSEPECSSVDANFERLLAAFAGADPHGTRRGLARAEWVKAVEDVPSDQLLAAGLRYIAESADVRRGCTTWFHVWIADRDRWQNLLPREPGVRATAAPPTWRGPPEIRDALASSGSMAVVALDRSTWCEEARRIVAARPSDAETLRLRLGGFHAERLNISEIVWAGE